MRHNTKQNQAKKITKFNSMLALSAVPGVLEKNKPFPKNCKIERKIMCFFKLFGLNLPSIFVFRVF